VGAGIDHLKVEADGYVGGDASLRTDRTGNLRAAIRLEPWGTLSGRVLDADGVPAGGADVIVDHGSRARTGRDGAFTVAGPTPSRARRVLVAARFGTAAPALTVAESASGIVLRLGRESTVSGVIVRPDGSPASGA